GRARSGGVAGGSGRVRDALTGGLLGRSYGYAAKPRVRGDDAGTESRESAGPSQTVRRDTGTSACGSGPLPCAWSTRSTAWLREYARRAQPHEPASEMWTPRPHDETS